MDRLDNTPKKNKLNTIEWLVDNFPAAFFKQPKQIKPLKIGIFDDLIDFYQRLETPAFSKKTLRESLIYYSSSPAYLKSQKVNAARVDLYGNEVDVVTETQAKYAHQRFQQRYAEQPKAFRVKI